MRLPACPWVRAGEEVRISYGSWPNDVFLLFFGFLPEEDNPHDSVVLFQGLAELALFEARRRGHAAERAQAAAPADAEAELARLLGAPEEAYRRLVVSAGGFDGRLLQAAGAALEAVAPPALAGAAGGREAGEGLRELLAARCSELLARYPTSAEEDEALLAGNPPPRLETALRYRLGKKRVLLGALAQLLS